MRRGIRGRRGLSFGARCVGALALVAVLAACGSATGGRPAGSTTVTTTVTATATATVTATAPAPDFGNFVHDWAGHTRSVDVTSTGVMTELVSSGCCDLALVVVLQLSNPTGTADNASADAEVLAVYSEDQTTTKGATGTVTVVNGILTDTIDRVTYCDQDVPSTVGQCGA